MRDDILWKGLLEDIFDDFLCFFHPNASQEFDMKRGFQFLDKELDQVFPPDEDQYHPKIVDKLVKVYTNSGDEKWVLVHVEVQGKYQKDFAQRMFTYFYRIFDKYKKPITAYAILTEQTKKPRANDFNLSYLGTTLQYRFNLYKIAGQQEAVLLGDNNPFALVVLTAMLVMKEQDQAGELSDRVLLEMKIRLAREFVNRQIPREKIRILLNFLRYYVRFQEKENNDIFD